MSTDKGIQIRNIFYMMTYALLEKKWDYAKLDAEDFDNVRNLLASLITRILNRQIKQGLYRQYREYQEDMTSPRGRIDVTGSIRLRVHQQRKLSVCPEDLSENNLSNRIIKTTIKELLRENKDRYNLKEKYRSSLKRLLPCFMQVDYINPSNIPWSTIQIDRNYRDYGILLRLCRFALESRLLSENSDEYRLPHITANDENELFEKFILGYYQIEHHLNAKVTEMEWPFDPDPGERLLPYDQDKKYMPYMRTDITLSKEVGDELRCLIIDAKYYTRIMADPAHPQKDKKVLKKGKFRSPNLYQIFTYVKTMEAKLVRDEENRNKKIRVAGLLMYAQTKEKPISESYSICGNEIGVTTLDLAREFKEIRKDLDKVANQFFNVNKNL